MANRVKHLENGSNGAVATLPEKPADSVSGISIIIPRVEPKIVELEIVGVTPLLVCRWSEKAKREIEEKQTGKAKASKKKEARDPHEEYLAGLYMSTEGWTGVPAGGVKGCLVNTCRVLDSPPMTLAKRIIFVRAQGRTADGQELVRVYGAHKMHSGMVRTATGVAMPRFRPIYETWSMKLEIEFLANVISPEQICNLVEQAGFVEGLAEHRPGSPKSNTGSMGRFRIRREEDK